MLHWALYAFPSLTMTFFSMYKVFALRRQVNVAPAAVQGSYTACTSNAANKLPAAASVAVDKSTTPGSSAQSESAIGVSISKSIRMILFTSGLLWLMMLPVYTGQSIILMSGVTMYDMDSGERLLEARVMRTLFLLMYTVTPALNLIVHLYTHPELRS